MRLEGLAIDAAWGRAQVLHEVTATIEPGAVLGIIGPNGSGKSTLVRVLAGLKRPLRGEVRLDGTSLALVNRRVRARQLGFVAQETQLAFPMTVRELVLLGRTPYTAGPGFEGPGDARAVAAALERVDLTRYAERFCDRISGGERQRAVLARALAQEPRVLLLDEPVSFLDLRHSVLFLDLVRDLARDEGLAVAVVLHDLNLAAMYCDQLLLLAQGRVAAAGRPADVLRYETLRTVYGTDLYVAPNDVTGQVVVLPLAREHRQQLAASSLRARDDDGGGGGGSGADY